MKLKYLLTFILTVIMAGSVFLVSSDNHVYSQDTTYDYALALEEYEIPDYSGLVTVKNPSGATVTVSNGKIILTKLGTYTIIYSNKIIYLKVYEKAVPVTFTYSHSLEASYVAGTKINIPTAVIKSEIQSYDNYNVKIKVNGATVATYNLIDSSTKYTLTASGSCSIVYEITDVFGINCTSSLDFTVTDKETLFLSDIPETWYWRTELNLGGSYGFYLGQSYSPAFEITSPAGEVSVLKGSYFTPEETGEYSLRIYTIINNKLLEKIVKINIVYSNSSLFGYCSSNNTVESAVNLPSYSYDKGSGVKITATSSGTSIYYNNIIDLNNLTKTDSVIAFQMLSDDTYSMSDIKITLTDANDPTNEISVYWYRNVYSPVHSYMLANFNGYSVGRDNEGEGTGILRPKYGSIAHYTSFYGDSIIDKCYLFNFQYDIEENAIYSYMQANYSQYMLVDFDDEELLQGRTPWEGFSTGEVYLRIDFTTINTNGGIIVTEIAGQSTEDEEISKPVNIQIIRLDKSNASLLGGMISGAVGYNYTLPSVINNNVIYGEVAVERKLYLINGSNLTDCTGLISGDSFLPSAAGSYRVVYSAIDNYGNNVKKEYNFTVNAMPDEINIILPQSQNVNLQSYYKIPEISINGGSGGVFYAVTVYCDDTEAYININGKVYINKKGVWKIEIDATDEIGYEKTSFYTLNILSDFQWLDVSCVPTAVRASETVIFPDFMAIDFSLDILNPAYYMSKSVRVNGTLLNDDFSYAVPTNLTSLTVEFIAGLGTEKQVIKTYNISVIAEVPENISEFLIYDKSKFTTTLFNTGMALQTSTDQTIEMPYALPANDLDFKFSLHGNMLNFNNLSILLEDYEDSSLQVRFKISSFTSSQATLTIGTNSIKINYATSTYSNTDVFDGITYKSFYFNFNDIYAIIQNANGTPLCNVKTFVNGDIFEGFPSGRVRLSFSLNGVTGPSLLCLNSVASQTFTSYSYVSGDKKGPVIGFENEFASNNCSINSYYTVPAAFACDVLQSSSTVKLTVSTPGGTALYSNADISTPKTISLSSYGYYTITYNAVDSKNNKSVYSIKVQVVDEISPEITVTGDVNAEYAVNTAITIPALNAFENYSKAELFIFMKRPDGKLVTVTAGTSYIFTSKGDYELIFYARDDSYNVSRKVYEITVI